ncbi:MAG: sigma-54-dependent Fis family transcriptional regulator [Magnetococcales bacterium]|nr:sigma-54-dependent Fis family transcriptional regulator [Magnetococcales bacterium]
MHDTQAANAPESQCDCNTLSLPVVVVDDDEATLAGVGLLLRSHGLGPVKTFADSRAVMPWLAQSGASVLLLDMNMPYISGRELLTQVQRTCPHIPVIVVTAVQDVDTAVACMKEGAVDYVLKPLYVDRLLAAVRQAKELVGLRRHADTLRNYLLGQELKCPEAFADIVTRSPKMQAIFKYMESVSRTGEPFLIAGETGTGKELLVTAFHALRKATGKLVAVNVAGLDDQMFADALFGHTKGAFTGALTLREGMVSKAAHGTLFLDEIGDLSEANQIKLLRLLQEKKYEPLGSDVSKNANVTIVSATNQDLKQKVRGGSFRADLYYRLSTHIVTVPPLRMRKEDIPLLLEKFIHEASLSMDLQHLPTPSPQLIHLLECHDFPGNVRELRGMVMDAVANHKKGTLSMEVFRQALTSSAPTPALPTNDRGPVEAPLFWAEGRKPPTLKEAEDYLIAHALAESQGNQGIAAVMLGLSRQTLNQRLARREHKSPRT